MALEVGDKIPDITLPATGGKEIGLRDFKGKTLIVYFYPKDNTPGCTNEAKDFRDLYAAFQARNAEVIGVSRDSVRSHANFAAKHELPFPLVSDADETWCKAFDVIHEKVLYGKRYLGVVRSTFLIDPSGRLAAEWRGIKIPGHAQAVLESVPTA